MDCDGLTGRGTSSGILPFALHVSSNNNALYHGTEKGDHSLVSADADMWRSQRELMPRQPLLFFICSVMRYRAILAVPGSA